MLKKYNSFQFKHASWIQHRTCLRTSGYIFHTQIEKSEIFHVTSGTALKNYGVITRFPYIGFVMFSKQWLQRLLSSGKWHHQFGSYILLSSFFFLPLFFFFFVLLLFRNIESPCSSEMLLDSYVHGVKALKTIIFACITWQELAG